VSQTVPFGSLFKGWFSGAKYCKRPFPWSVSPTRGFYVRLLVSLIRRITAFLPMFFKRGTFLLSRTIFSLSICGEASFEGRKRMLLMLLFEINFEFSCCCFLRLFFFLISFLEGDRGLHWEDWIKGRKKLNLHDLRWRFYSLLELIAWLLICRFIRLFFIFSIFQISIIWMMYWTFPKKQKA